MSASQKHIVNIWIFWRQGRQRIVFAFPYFQKIQTFTNAGEHAEAEKVDFEHAERVDVVFVPFDDSAVDHRRVFNRAKLIKPSLCDDKAADML